MSSSRADIDAATWHQWYVIDSSDDLRTNQPRQTKLLGRHVYASRDNSGNAIAREVDAEGKTVRSLPVTEKYGYVFTTLGEPEVLFDMPEFEDPERRLVICGGVSVRTSPARIIENFLDMSHFPFVHGGVLGAEPLTEVADYKVHEDENSGELWATECGFNQPQAMASSTGSADVDYRYRIAQPFSAVLYKSCPEREGEFDLVGIFPQPLNETSCDVHCFMLVYDEHSSLEGMIQWQQGIFLQDRIILENQRPARLPLTPRAEKANSADLASVRYRHWLKNLGIAYGTC